MAKILIDREMAKKVGKGIFIRSEPWQCYHAERNGYIYFISDKKNFTADKGWKIMQREGGREFVYVLMRQRKGFWQYKGEKAYEKYEKILKKRRERNNKITYKGYDEYAIKKENGVLIYSFSFERQEHGKSWDKDIEKTRLAVYYEEEYVSDYFASFRECLEYAENKLL